LRKTARWLPIALCLLLVVVVIVPAQAEVPPPPPSPKIVSPQALQLIRIGYCSIYQKDFLTVRLSGYTENQIKTDYIGFRFTLEKWDGANWVLATTYIFEDYDSDYVSGSYSYPVELGYYYRAKGTHLATDGSTSERITSYSEPIKIK
jgi:hypothetical protein